MARNVAVLDISKEIVADRRTKKERLMLFDVRDAMIIAIDVMILTCCLQLTRISISILNQ